MKWITLSLSIKRHEFFQLFKNEVTADLRRPSFLLNSPKGWMEIARIQLPMNLMIEMNTPFIVLKEWSELVGI